MVDARWVALSLSRHIGGKTLRALLTHFDNDLDAILAADVNALKAVTGVGKTIAQAITELDVEQTAQAIANWQASDVQIIPRNDIAYPTPLIFLDDEPPTLFMRGQSDSFLWEKAIAIVGTRNPTSPMRQIALRLGAHFAEQGYTIVSGLALGVDTAAHQGALSIPNGRSIAVLGCGVLNIYPRENRQLADLLLKRGAILGEVHPQAGVSAARLVARNRIISGLCSAVIIVQTTVDGGAMYAAKRAFEQGRKVYVLDCGATGNRALIEQGAIPVPLDISGFMID